MSLWGRLLVQHSKTAGGVAFWLPCSCLLCSITSPRAAAAAAEASSSSISKPKLTTCSIRKGCSGRPGHARVLSGGVSSTHAPSRPVLPIARRRRLLLSKLRACLSCEFATTLLLFFLCICIFVVFFLMGLAAYSSLSGASILLPHHYYYNYFQYDDCCAVTAV